MKSLEPRVFVQQAAKNTKSSGEIVRNLLVSIEEIRAYLETDEYDYLEELKLRTLVMRGVDATPDGRNEGTWAEMEMGDVALIAWRGHIEAAGEVLMRKRSSALARLRNPTHGRYHLLYFLANVDRLHVPYGELNKVLGYKANNYFQRFVALPEHKSTAVLDLLRRVEPRLSLLSERALVQYGLQGEMDGRAEVNRRREQKLLRKLYFGGRDHGACAVCGRIFPIAFLVAAHIKKRATCSDDEKRDAFGNIIPACRFGCDELFERGYILGIEGVFRRSEVKATTDVICGYIDLVAGRPIQDWERRAKYFKSHAESHSLGRSLPPDSVG